MTAPARASSAPTKRAITLASLRRQPPRHPILAAGSDSRATVQFDPPDPRGMVKPTKAQQATNPPWLQFRLTSAGRGSRTLTELPPAVFEIQRSFLTSAARSCCPTPLTTFAAASL